jgi:hypothetical protein
MIWVKEGRGNKMRYIFWTIGVALLITATVFIWHPTALYDYKGYAVVTIEKALQIESERGNQVVTFDNASDTASLFYDFSDTKQGDYGFTGVLHYHPSGWLIVCGVFGFFSTGLGFITWDESRSFILKCLPGRNKRES